MDARRCYFPNNRMEDYFQPSPSHWPLSHIRSSVRNPDDSSEKLDTFKMEWVEDQHIPIPYQQRTIRNLTGRSWDESFAKFHLKRKRSSPCSEPLLSSASPREPEARGSLRKDCSSSDECQSTSRLVMGLTNSDEIEEMKQTPTLNPHACKQCDMTFPRDSDLQQHNQRHTQGNHPTSCTNAEAATITMSIDIPSSPRTWFSIQREKLSPPPQEQPTAHEWEPTIVSKPSSQNDIDSTALLPREQSEDDNLKDDESSRPKVKKPKQKSNQQVSHICKLCEITFTRHFDLLRHNQKHEPELEDMARRTCTNCDRVLSRVDATKRHVDTLPESCNYLRRKQGLSPLPAMPVEHYDACREQYHKLAQERKKPKGRKKANPAA